MTAQEHISKVARMLANQQADACGVDREDNWRLCGGGFIADTAEAMSSVLAHIDQQQAEIERLRSESEGRLQNCAALLAEVERLRAAPATAPAQPEIVDLLAEMYELILANKVVLAEKSGGVWTWPDRAIEAVRKHRSGPAQPERKPMGQFEIEAAYQESQQHHLRPQDFNKVCDMVRAVEAFHGIKEAP